MIKKFILFFFITISLNHCGFSPLYSSGKQINFNIEITSLEGESIINRYLKIYLNRFKSDGWERNYKIKVNSKYEKNILSKDKAAKITNYQLSVDSFFEISLDDKIVKKITISEKKNIESTSDKLEEDKLERTIKQNFASSISNRLISILSVIDAN